MVRISDNFKRRSRILSLFFFAAAALLGTRLFFIQVSAHNYYETRAKRQYFSYKSKPSISIRGDIYFKEKDGNLISAATIKDGFLVAVNPEKIKDAQSSCEEINKILPIDVEQCVERCSKENDPFEIIAHRLDTSEAKKIKSLHISGVGIYPEEWRFYPGNSLASQVLGFVGYKDDELVGRYGLERYYEDVLRGKKESLSSSNSFAVSFFNLGKNLLGGGIASGHDIVLTIEPTVQALLEKELSKIKEKWHGEEAGGIIMDPKTGAIIAMASKPDFNPNTYNKVEDISYFRNPLVSDIFEVGSVMKPLTMAAALDSGSVDKRATYFDKGYVILNGRRIENYDGKGRGRVGLQEILNQSLNTGAVFLMQQIGKEQFLEYFKSYGFGEKTGIDLPAETKGDLSNLSFMRDVDFGTASFGQGIAITPIEFTTVVSALANGGLLVRPYVVGRINIEGGKDKIIKPQAGKRVLKKETSKEVTRMLVKVVDDALLGGTVKMKRYSIAAKTGTAQLPKSDGPGYEKGEYLHTFFGYGPAFDARFVIFLYLKKPQGVRYASHSLTAPFMDIMRFLFNYYEIPPDR